MTLARVVAFKDVSAARIEQLRSEISSTNGPPEEIPATELLILHDPQAEKSLAIVLFDNEDDYARGDAALSAMPADETPGHRVSIDKYEVAMRMTREAAPR
jgi:hypothetical protein